MYFQKGKRKGNSSFKVVDSRSCQSTRFNVPVAIANQTANVLSEEVSVLDNLPDENDCCMVDDALEYDSDVDLGAQPSYKKRKEQLSSNWSKIRHQLLQKSFEIDGFLSTVCSQPGCSQPGKTRCRDCGYCVYYCIECCNEAHKEKLQFHVCEILEAS